jgi:hypothetical protein
VRGDIAAALGRTAEEVRVDRRDVLVPFSDEAAAVAGLRSLVSAGLPIVEFAPAVGDLEHAFLDLRAEASPPTPDLPDGPAGPRDASPPGSWAPPTAHPVTDADRTDDGSTS